MDVEQGELDAIVYILLESGQPVEGIEERARAWQSLLRLLDMDHTPEPASPSDSRLWQEFQFIPRDASAATELTEKLQQLGLEPKRPFTRQGRTVIPVYSSRHRWLGRLLALARSPEGAASWTPGDTPEIDPEQLSAIEGVLRGAGLSADDPDKEAEKAQAWASVRPLVISFRQGATPLRRAEGRRGWELRMVVESQMAAARLSRVLTQLGVQPGRPFSRREQVVVPVQGDQHQWLVQLLEIGKPPAPPPPAPRPPGRPRKSAPQPSRVRTWPRFDPETALQIVTSDPTFEKSTWQGKPVYAGRCPQCSGLLMVGMDGERVSAAHVARLGEGESERMVLLCLRCAARLRSREPRGRRSETPGQAEASRAGEGRSRPASPKKTPPPAPEIDEDLGLDPHTRMVRVLREGGHPVEGIDEKIRVWQELLPLVVLDSHRRSQEIQFVAATPVGAVRIDQLLRQLGVKAGRPFEKQGQIIVPVPGQRHPWLARLLAVSRQEAASAGRGERSSNAG